MANKLHKALRTQKQNTQQVALEIYGTLGIPIDGAKAVEVPNRPSFVYVRLRDNQNEVIQAFNNKVAASYGLPVVIIREGNRYVIQGVNTQRYQNNWNNYSPYLPKHGTAHSFADGGGGDVSWIFSRQFMPNLVYPNSGGVTGTSAYIAPHVLLDANRVWRYVGATGTDNLLNYKGTGSSSTMLLIYINATNGNPGILVGSGSYFSNTLTGTASIYPYIPVPDPATQIPLAAVRMDTGTASITWDNLYDVRQFVHAMPSGTSTGGGGGGVDTIGFVGQNKGVYLATGTVLNVNGSRLTLTSSGTVFNLTNSPDPQELIGIYGMSGTAGLGTGTSISFSNGIIASITGTTLYAGLHFGTGTNQVASGDRGVTSGNNHQHVGGDGGEISTAMGQAISLASSKNPPIGADSVGGYDSVGGGFVRFTLTNIRTFFKDTYDTLYAPISVAPAAESNANDIFQVASPGGVSLWTATINGAPAGTSVTVNAPSSGTEGVLVPVSTSQLAKMRLYNLTRGNSALISDYNTGTNVITLTATVPGTWANGDSLSVVSQTVSGGGFNWIDLEITSGPTGKSGLFMFGFFTGGVAGNSLRFHPLETFGAGKVTSVQCQVATVLNTGLVLTKITSNVFSIAWTGSPTGVVIREAGYL